MYTPAALDVLPPELLLHILSYLSIRDLAVASEVCQEWHGIINQNDACFWRPFVMQINPDECLGDKTFIDGDTWRARLKEFKK